MLPLLLLAALGESQTFLPMQFSTVGNSFQLGLFYYYIPFCGFESNYDGYTGTVVINLLSGPWNPAGAFYVEVNIYKNSALSELVSSSLVSGTYLQTWSFTYDEDWGDLYFKIRIPNAPIFLTYSLSTTFTAPLSKGGVPRVHNVTVPTSFRVSKPQYVGGTQPAVIFDPFRQYYAIPQAYQIVDPFDWNTYSFLFCPVVGSSYNVISQATCYAGAPAGCAVSAYMCTNPAKFPCSPDDSDQSDTAAAGIALVMSDTNDFNLFQVAVANAGNYNTESYFLLTTTTIESLG